MTVSLRLASHPVLIYFQAYCFVIRAAVGIMCTVAVRQAVMVAVAQWPEKGNTEDECSTNNHN
jgi:hypothetical protein